MHHLTVDEWSRGASYLHLRDARVKVAVLLLYLIVLATTPMAHPLPIFALQMFTYGAVLLAGIAVTNLPPGALEMRAAVVLPFSLTFALVSWLAGDPSRALLLVIKSYLSALAVLLIIATTPVPALLRALESLGAPRVFVLIMQFLHRYLFVISEQAQHMRLAAACRQGEHRVSQAVRFRAAAGAVSVLFARSYARAEGIHRAMISRGFEGRFPAASPQVLRVSDWPFLLGSVLAIAAIRAAFPVR